MAMMMRFSLKYPLASAAGGGTLGALGLGYYWGKQATDERYPSWRRHDAILDGCVLGGLLGMIGGLVPPFLLLYAGVIAIPPILDYATRPASAAEKQ